MDRVTALQKVLADSAYNETEKNSALAALQDIAANAETSHERETASNALKELEVSVPERPLDSNLRELLDLIGATEAQYRAISEQR